MTCLKYKNKSFSVYQIFLLLLILVLILNKPAIADIKTIDNLIVTKVIDGDTIWVKDINRNLFYKVRLLGINAPELFIYPPEAFAKKSKKRTEELLKNQKIYINYEDNYKYDKYNRLLGQVYRKRDNLWINYTLVKEGLAYVYIIKNNIIGLKELIDIENIAIYNKINLWNLSQYRPIKPEEAFKYNGKYKIVIGEVQQVIITKNNIWLVFQNNNHNIYKKFFFNTNQNFLKNKYYFSVKINKKVFLTELNWYSLKNKTIKVRGFINSTVSNYSTFINLINLLTIEPIG